MNCSHCEKEITASLEIVQHEFPEDKWAFCSWGCLRAWLGPDPEIKKVLSELQQAITRPE